LHGCAVVRRARVPWVVFTLALLATAGDAWPAGECRPTVPIWVDGRQEGSVCAAQAAREGYTVINLSDDWTPFVLSRDPDYRPVLVALANERWGEPGVTARAERDRYLELYGIFPSFAVIHERMSDAERHACHDAVDDAALTVGGELDRDARRAAQEHLACEGFLQKASGREGSSARRALRLYQRRHMIPAKQRGLDESTRQAMLADSRELDYLTALRALRERVVDATGLIADGSAGGRWGMVLGRYLEPTELRDTAGREPMADAAEDEISPAVEAAAQALGWTSPEAAAAWLASQSTRSLRVAVKLPAPPDHQRRLRNLRVEIDRGDVDEERGARGVPVGRRPVLVLYAKGDDEDEVALVRWPTTIGGWQREKLPDGGVEWKYKPSPTGHVVWRRVVAGPAWFAPLSTPDRELMRGGRPDEDVIGPGYRSAYGLVMLMHERPSAEGDVLSGADTAIRTHGTAHYKSVLGGYSHGCHRLFNHLALRLASVVVHQRSHVVVGLIRQHWSRDVGGHTVSRDTRGWGFDLLEPIPVTVTEGP
jgi:hypothetical protein